jgi:DNA-binding CsgD family transcriptional regulator
MTPNLSARHVEVLRLIGEGLSTPEIAEEMGMNKRLAKYYVDELRRKFAVTHKRELVPIARAYEKASA